MFGEILRVVRPGVEAAIGNARVVERERPGDRVEDVRRGDREVDVPEVLSERRVDQRVRRLVQRVVLSGERERASTRASRCAPK